MARCSVCGNREPYCTCNGPRPEPRPPAQERVDPLWERVMADAERPRQPAQERVDPLWEKAVLMAKQRLNIIDSDIVENSTLGPQAKIKIVRLPPPSGVVEKRRERDYTASTKVTFYHQRVRLRFTVVVRSERTPAACGVPERWGMTVYAQRTDDAQPKSWWDQYQGRVCVKRLEDLKSLLA
jgi:hypothetical protein